MILERIKEVLQQKGKVDEVKWEVGVKQKMPIEPKVQKTQLYNCNQKWEYLEVDGRHFLVEYSPVGRPGNWKENYDVIEISRLPKIEETILLWHVTFPNGDGYDWGWNPSRDLHEEYFVSKHKYNFSEEYLQGIEDKYNQTFGI